MIGDIILFLKKWWKQNITCHHEYVYKEFGRINFEECRKCGGIVMAFVAVDYIGEWIFNYKPDMWAGDCIEHNYWLPQDRHGAYGFQLPKGSIKKLIGRELSWSDEPVELKEE